MEWLDVTDVTQYFHMLSIYKDLSVLCEVSIDTNIHYLLPFLLVSSGAV